MAVLVGRAKNAGCHSVVRPTKPSCYAGYRKIGTEFINIKYQLLNKSLWNLIPPPPQKKMATLIQQHRQDMYQQVHKLSTGFNDKFNFVSSFVK